MSALARVLLDRSFLPPEICHPMPVLPLTTSQAPAPVPCPGQSPAGGPVAFWSVSRVLRLLLGLAAMAYSTVELPAAEDAPSAAAKQPATTGTEGSEAPSPEAIEFFEKKIRPVLVATCYDCHSEDSVESGLRVDSLAGLLRGGTRGPALVPGRPEASLLISAVNHGELLQMPPKDKLSVQQLQDLSAWVKMGAPWPGATATEVTSDSLAGGSGTITAEDLDYWSFRPVVRPAVPAVQRASWIRNPVDAFILAGLEAKNLTPAPPASRRTLIRRATFDLTGLPPTPEQVARFLADTRPDAFERLIERLLASPAYGERWGRHWLDVARYADSNGMDENLAFVSAFRYRDYVINAFNEDLPFNRFVHEQLAGDLLPAAPGETPQQYYRRLTATGFLSIGPKMLADDDPVKKQMDIIDEQLDTLSRAFMGMTLGCARCHDHKFDPIPTADYYALAGILKSTKTMEYMGVVATWHEYTLLPEEEQQRVAEIDKQLKALDDRLNKLKKRRNELREKQKQQKKNQPAAEQPAEEASPGDEKDPGPPSLQEQLAEVQQQLQTLTQKRNELAATRPDVPRAMGVREGSVENVRIHLRGSHLTLGREEPRHFLQLAAGVNQPLPDDNSSGRLELARWLTDPAHPLTSRVIVNRIWQWHFGEGLVRTPDNFGRTGETPSHPALLDWLATEMIRRDWSLKQLHRLLLTSSAWQMSTRYSEAAARVDPENRLLWRMNRRRLEAEEVRDSLLQLGGALTREMHGQLLDARARAYVTGTGSKVWRYDFNRRSVYLPVLRSAVYNVFQAFDFADPSVLNGRRATTTVTPQALFMMNSSLMADSSRGLADQLLALGEQAPSAARIDRAFEITLCRQPSSGERQRFLEFLEAARAELTHSQTPAEEVERLAWRSLCRVLLASSEFVYVE